MFNTSKQPASGGLFGASTSQPAQSGGLFGNLNTAQTPSSGSLFGGVGGSNQAAGASIFGSTTPAATTAPSLFGASTVTSAPTGGLFGATTTATTQPQSSGLFGTSTAKPLSGGLFGGVQSSTPAPSTGLFGSTVTPSTQAQGGGLFGSTTTTSQPQTTNLLGQTSNQQQNATQGQDRSIFGQTTGTTLPPQALLNGRQAQGTPQTAFFDSLLERGRKRVHEEGTSFGDVPSLEFGLGDISKKLNSLAGESGQPKRVIDTKAHYLLASSGVAPSSALRDIRTLTTEPGVHASREAVSFDPDNEKYVRQLQQRSRQAMIEEGLQRARKDFDAYLDEHVNFNWEQQRRRIQEHFGLVAKGSADKEDLQSSVRGSFSRSSRRPSRLVVNGETPSTMVSRSVFGHSAMQKSVIGSPAAGADDGMTFTDVSSRTGVAGAGAANNRFLREKESKFAGKVRDLNENRLQNNSYPILKHFLEVETQSGGETPSQLGDAYNALIEIVGEKSEIVSNADPSAVKERYLAKPYLNDDANSAEAMSIRARIIDGSRRFLEKKFFHGVEQTIEKNPHEAKLGGIPTVINKMRAYIRVRAARKDLAHQPESLTIDKNNEDYCWVLVFFLLRCGFVKEAMEYVSDDDSNFKSLDRNFVTYVKQYEKNADRRLSRKLQNKINNEYQQRLRIAPEASLDPYRSACYKIVGRCDLSKRNLDGIKQDVDDWVWLQFNLGRERSGSEQSAEETFGLDHIRETVHDIGQRHFAKGSEGTNGGYGTFFLLQILSGMFENAVSYLYSFSYVSAVHFAIALDYYGFLRVADFSVAGTELLSFTTTQQPQINFGRMIGYYTRDFRAASPESAVDYICLICLNASLPGSLGQSQAFLCHEALRELVLETREFAQLLGDIRRDGTRIRGAIEQRLRLIGLDNQRDYLKAVTVQAAAVADDNGRVTDAVLLYHLADECDTVIEIVCRALSEAVTTELGQEPMKLQPAKLRHGAAFGMDDKEVQPDPNSSLSLVATESPYTLAKNILALYEENSSGLSNLSIQSHQAMVDSLCTMYEARELVQSRQWAAAVDHLSSILLLPLSLPQTTSTLRSCAASVSALPPVLATTVGPLLSWSLHCLSQQKLELEASEFGDDPMKRHMSAEIITRAKNLMTWAGLVKYRISSRVWEECLEMAGDMGVY